MPVDTKKRQPWRRILRTGMRHATTSDQVRRRPIVRAAGLALAGGIAAAGLIADGVLAARDPAALDANSETVQPLMIDPGADFARPPARPAREKETQTGNPLWAVPLSTLTVTRERPLFSPSRRPPPPVVAAPTAPRVAAPPPRPPEPDHPLLTLIGTIASGSEGIGIFLDQATRAVVQLKTGQSHDGWLLRAIHGREAEFEKRSLDATLSLPPRSDTEPTSGFPAPGPKGAPMAAMPKAGKPWMDGDGRMIQPPPNRAAPPVAAPFMGIPLTGNSRTGPDDIGASGKTAVP